MGKSKEPEKRANRRGRDKVVVLVTCGSAGEAHRIARGLVRNRLAACVNVLEGRVRSTYRWKGKIETAHESLLLVKTSRKMLSAVRRNVEELHSYELPEVIALPIVAGSPRYLAWLEESVRPLRVGKPRRAIAKS